MADDVVRNLDLPIDTYNFADQTKWVFNIPFGRLFNAIYKNVRHGYLLDYPLNCKSVSFPEFKLGSTTVQYLNYSFELSNRSNLTDKVLQITFGISENWLQYLMLLKWFELSDFTRYNEDRQDTTLIDAGAVKQTIATSDLEKAEYKDGTNPYYSVNGPVVDTNLYLMDNFMNRKCTFNFTGCWLKRVKNVDLDYSKTDGTEVVCTFDMAYYKYNVVNNGEDLQKLFPEGSVN